MTPSGCGQFGLRGLIGRINVGDNLTLLHTKYLSSRSHEFREEDFLSFSHYKSLGANDLQGLANFRPRGHGWQDLCMRPLNITSYFKN